MNQIALIDEVELGKNYPIPFAIDGKRLEATIILSQRTKLRDFLGERLYDAYIDYASNEDSTLFDVVDSDLRMLISLYTAANLYRAYYADKEQSIRDFNMSSVNGDVKFYEILVMNRITSTPTLSAMISSDSINDTEISPASSSGVHYWS